jgi:hypothetical protein
VHVRCDMHLVVTPDCDCNPAQSGLHLVVTPDCDCNPAQAGLFAVALLIILVRVGSSPRGQQVLSSVWSLIASTSLGQAIFFCTKS